MNEVIKKIQELKSQFQEKIPQKEEENAKIENILSLLSETKDEQVR